MHEQQIRSCRNVKLQQSRSYPIFSNKLRHKNTFPKHRNTLETLIILSTFEMNCSTNIRKSRHQDCSIYTTPKHQNPHVSFVMPRNKDLVRDSYQESSLEMFGFVSPPLPFLPNLDESEPSILDHNRGVMLAMKACHRTFPNIHNHSIRSKVEVSRGFSTPTRRTAHALGLSFKTAKAA